MLRSTVSDKRWGEKAWVQAVHECVCSDLWMQAIVERVWASCMHYSHWGGEKGVSKFKFVECHRGHSSCRRLGWSCGSKSGLAPF